MYMKKLFAVALAFLVCVVMTGCAVEKVASVSADLPEVIALPQVVATPDDDEPEPEWNDDEVDAQIPSEYLTAEDDWDDEDWDAENWDAEWDEEADWEGEDGWDDGDWDEEDFDGEELDYGIPRTLALAADGTLVDGQPVDYIISDEMFASQMDEIAYYPDGYVGKRFAVTGYVMLADEPAEDEHGFAVVRDYQEPHSDDEDYEDDGEYMTAEEFAAMIESMGGAIEVEDAELAATPDPAATLEPGATMAFPDALVPALESASAAETVDPGATAAPVALEPVDTPAPFAGIEVQPGESVSLDDVASLSELGAQISIDPDPEADAADAADEEDHEHEIYPVGIDCYFEGEIPQADAWVRVVGTLEEYDFYDAEVGESFPALRLNLQSVTAIPETEGGSRLVTQ